MSIFAYSLNALNPPVLHTYKHQFLVQVWLEAGMDNWPCVLCSLFDVR